MKRFFLIAMGLMLCAPTTLLFAQEKNQIFLRNVSTGTELFVVDGVVQASKARIEITTPIDGVNIIVDNRLGAKITRTTVDNGTDKKDNLLYVEIDMDRFGRLKNAVELTRRTYEAFEDSVDRQLYDFGDEVRAREIYLENSMNEAEKDWQTASLVRIVADQNLYSNEETIPTDVMANLSGRQRVLFTLSPLRQEVTTWGNEYLRYMDDAAGLYKTRKYAEALASYKRATEVEGISEDQRSIAESRMKKMEEYSKLKQAATQQVNAINQMRKEADVATFETAANTVDYNMVEEYYNAAIANFKSLLRETDPNDEYYTNMVNRLNAAKEKLGVVIMGKVVKTDYKGGKIVETNASDMWVRGLTFYDEKLMKKGMFGDELEGGELDGNGVFRVQIPRNKYRGLLFIPKPGSKIKENTFFRLDGNKHLRSKISIKD